MKNFDLINHQRIDDIMTGVLIVAGYPGGRYEQITRDVFKVIWPLHGNTKSAKVTLWRDGTVDIEIKKKV